MKLDKISVLFFLLFSNVAVASEVKSALDHITHLEYPLPHSTISDIHKIESELTPLPVVEPARVLQTELGWLCNSEIVSIPYQLNPDEEVAFFEATIVRPNQVFTSAWFSDLPFPAIVIQPTLAGVTILEETISVDLCLMGVVSITPNKIEISLPELLPDFESYDRNMRLEMIKARRMVDYLSTRTDVNTNKIGAIGFSRGAIAGALLIGIEPRIRFAFLGGGGVGVAQIIATSRTELGMKNNARHMDAAGMNQKQYESTLIDTLRYDGILFSHRVEAERVKIMIVHNDDSVATENQELLKKSFANPDTIYLDRGHVGSIMHQVFADKLTYLKFIGSQIRSL